jgi:hypothetical protein
MISIDYAVKFNAQNLENLTDRVNFGVQSAMQVVLDNLVANIKGQFDDTQLANTVTAFIEEASIGNNNTLVTGRVTSTWANMKYYEEGRQPGGKMPPIEALVAYAERHGIQPDLEKSQVAFAFAINVARQRRNKHRVPVDVLVEWQNKMGIVVPPEFAVNSMAYAMGKKIVKEGIAGRHYFKLGLAASQAMIHNSFENVVISTTGIR